MVTLFEEAREKKKKTQEEFFPLYGIRNRRCDNSRKHFRSAKAPNL